jgi:hypothetical protein
VVVQANAWSPNERAPDLDFPPHLGVARGVLTLMAIGWHGWLRASTGPQLKDTWKDPAFTGPPLNIGAGDWRLQERCQPSSSKTHSAR